MDITELQARLSEPFHPKRVHWRVGSTWERNGKTFTNPLAYIDARDVMERLDAVIGSSGWSDRYEETPSGRIICRLSVVLPMGKDSFEWVTKSDGAGSTGFEGEKGAISDAFKRAAVKFGIGRYLYGIKSEPVELERGKYLPRAWLEHTAPKLLPTYRPMFYDDWRKFTDALMEHSESILKMKEWFGEISRRKELQQTNDILAAIEDYKEQAKAEWLAVSNEDKQALNRPWTKGGVWTPEETKIMKSW